MNQLEEKRGYFFNSLESKGWYWEKGFIYAPHRTIWFCEVDTWLNDIFDFYQRMKERKERIIGNKQYHSDPQQHEDCVNDAEGLIIVIEEFIKKHN